MKQGVFISLDGVDGTGKSTQCRLLAEWLRGQGYDVVTCADPGGTAVGNVLRTVLLEHRGDLTTASEALLFMASRAQLVAEVIRPALILGKTVVSDRFLLANVVYQGHAGGLDPDLLWTIGHMATGGLEPDLTLVLDLPAEIAGRRKGAPADRIERRGQEFQERVRMGFLTEAARRTETIRVVDSSLSVDQVQQRIRAEVTRVVAAHPGP